MKITRLDSQLLRLPLSRPITSPATGERDGRLDHVFMLVVHLDTDAGLRGLGFAYALQGGGRALKAVADEAGERFFDGIVLRLETSQCEVRGEGAGEAAHAASDVECSRAGHRIGIARSEHQGRSDAQSTTGFIDVQTA